MARQGVVQQSLGSAKPRQAMPMPGGAIPVSAKQRQSVDKQGDGMVRHSQGRVEQYTVSLSNGNAIQYTARPCIGNVRQGWLRKAWAIALSGCAAHSNGNASQNTAKAMWISAKRCLGKAVRYGVTRCMAKAQQSYVAHWQGLVSKVR